MNEADEESGIAKIVHGDEASARELRANLAVFARRSGSPEIRQMVASVLAGHRNIRDVLQTSEFNQTGMRHLENIERGLSRLTDEQHAELFDPSRPRTPNEKLAAMRDAYDVDVPLVESPPEARERPKRRPARRPRDDEDEEDFSQGSIYEPW